MCKFLWSFFFKAVINLASQPMFVLVLSTRTALAVFQYPQLEHLLQQCWEYLCGWDVYFVFISLVISKWHYSPLLCLSCFFTILLCNLLVLQSVFINPVINTTADELFIVLDMLIIVGYFHSCLFPMYFWFINHNVCRREDNLFHMVKWAHLCLACKMSGMPEREKRNMAALTPQFKTKCNLKWGKFVRVTYGNFF